jgi:NADPH:quinone reductase-like Zn-dependent oxidoreductase
MTAAVALSKHPLKAGERLLVTAATGGVGAYAIQLGREAGARVTAFTRDAGMGPRYASWAPMMSRWARRRSMRLPPSI